MHTPPNLPGKASEFRLVILIPTLLMALAIAGFLAFITTLTSVSGRGEVFTLEQDQTRLGTLYIHDDASAILQAGSHWIGPIIAKPGVLIVEKDVFITGPVLLLSHDLLPGENTTLHGSIFLFVRGVRLLPGTKLGHGVVKTENIDALVSWRLDKFVLGNLLKWMLLFVLALGLFTGLAFSLGRRGRSRVQDAMARIRATVPTPQASAPIHK